MSPARFHCVMLLLLVRFKLVLWSLDDDNDLEDIQDFIRRVPDASHSFDPPNLPDKIARGITAARGPNDWSHSVTATRTKLLDLARAREMEERRHIIDENVYFLAAMQSSMNSTTDAKADHIESIARLSHRLQRHEFTFHHPYLFLLTCVVHRTFPFSLDTQLISASQRNIRKSTTSSNSNSTFGTRVSASRLCIAPLRLSSLRRLSTLALASSCNMRIHPEGDENLFKTAEFRRSGGYPDGVSVNVKVNKVLVLQEHRQRRTSKRPIQEQFFP
ncbi:hypothetical protein BDR03DRAFT_996267 [Suillus americanus]|nr:hypothetical protein BDR03DRAFT_996267 [Suillus americanus]